MNTAIFIVAVILFAAIFVYKNSAQIKDRQPETLINIHPPTPESDDYIRMLSFNPKEFDNAKEFGEAFEENLEQVISYYQVKNCTCNIEFVTVGICLVAVIHIRTLPGKKKRGILWNRQSAGMKSL